MIEIDGIKYANDCDDDVDKILSDYKTAKYRDPMGMVLNDMDIDIFRHAAIITMENAQIDGWVPPYCNEEDNIMGCIEHTLAGADAADCLKMLELEFYDIIQSPEEYKYLVTPVKTQ